ncbi:MAG TPA: SH3 domain-containing protein [Spirochaetota bacterium]|nr:SH3 domain-containing protein [Spirochaetota bacterium]HNT10050.1 SH3 domain-containing protein [Spirochaetota bacterium]
MIVRSGARASLIILLAVLVAAGALACKKSRSDALTADENLGLIIRDNTALRLDPLFYSSRISVLKKGETVAILDRSKKKGYIGTSGQYWYKVALKSGITGWVFGGTIRVLSDKNASAVEDQISDLMQEESKQLRRTLAGKWWSIDSFGEFTNHILDIEESGKYKSSERGGKSIEGKFQIRVRDQEIVFDKGTSFERNLFYARRGVSYFLENNAKDKGGPIKFKKLVGPESLEEANKYQQGAGADKPKEQAPDKPTEKAPEGGAAKQPPSTTPPTAPTDGTNPPNK